MILYVDLKCPCCYKKVRKLLCKFPQIRDQVFDVDKNKVIITVVCCDPERFRDKLCCKGGRAIQSIEIVENKPPPPKPTPALPLPLNLSLLSSNGATQYGIHNVYQNILLYYAWQFMKDYLLNYCR